MTRNNTLDKVHLAATERPQLLPQNTICLERQPHKVAVRHCAAVKLTEKNQIVGSPGAVSQCIIADDANVHV